MPFLSLFHQPIIKDDNIKLVGQFASAVLSHNVVLVNLLVDLVFKKTNILSFRIFKCKETGQKTLKKSKMEYIEECDEGEDSLDYNDLMPCLLGKDDKMEDDNEYDD